MIHGEMATFAKTTFDAARYAAARPTYPLQLYNFLFDFHGRSPRARWDTALDLGCGTGQATFALTPYKRIIGADPSPRMIAQASALLADPGASNAPLPPDVDVATVHAMKDRVSFVQSKAEELGWLEDGSVDMVVAAQAAHWFDWTRLWPEVARIVRPGGSLAIWGYSEFRLANHPSCTPLIHAYAQGFDPRMSLGPHWERPGRTIVDDHLQPIPDPRDVCEAGTWETCERVYFVGAHYPHLPDPRPVLLRKRTTWGGVLSYLRTFSALHAFHEQFPEDKVDPRGDIAVRFWEQLRAQVAEDKRALGKTGGADDGAIEGVDEEIEIEWPMAVVLAQRAL